MTAKLQGIRGMEDVLPDQTPLWQKVEDATRRVFEQYGYRNIRTPIVEPTPLFVRGLGEVTDIVEKEMYVFEDRNGESLALRPEATAGIVRSAIEHNFLYNGPMRVWTAGPMFRYERPQKGRQRQFHQFDVEALGFEGPDVDAEQIVMLARLWKALALPDVELHINSIGDASDRRAHRTQLVRYFEVHANQLDEDAQRRLHANPLRILDSKNPSMQEMIEGAPRLVDMLGDAAARHFQGLQDILLDAEVAFKVNPRLVRGLDYYNRTVFEWISPHIGAQSTIAGGGRYDGLFEQLGGKPTPACGFAGGIERVVLAMKAATGDQPSSIAAYFLFMGDQARRRSLTDAEAVRSAGLSAIVASVDGFKTAMKKADQSGARFALLIGDEEVRSNQVSLKPLRGEGRQELMPLAEAIERMKR